MQHLELEFKAAGPGSLLCGGCTSLVDTCVRSPSVWTIGLLQAAPALFLSLKLLQPTNQPTMAQLRMTRPRAEARSTSIADSNCGNVIHVAQLVPSIAIRDSSSPKHLSTLWPFSLCWSSLGPQLCLCTAASQCL